MSQQPVDLADLIDLPRVHKLLESLHRATGVSHALIGCDGEVHAAAGWQEICVRYHRSHPDTCIRCHESQGRIADCRGDAPYIGYRCPQGLMDYAVPLMVDGAHIATLFTGQLLHEPPDLGFFEAQARACGFEPGAYLAALAKVPVVAQGRMAELMTLQVEVAALLAAQAEDRLRRREAERELEEFSYSISHDLRSPLRAIAGFGRILADEYGGRLDDEGRRLLGIISDNATRMGELIDAIVGFVRVGRRPTQECDIDMQALAAEARSEVLAASPQRHLHLAIGELPPARGDRALVRLVLSHLLSNALKFSAARAEAVIEIGAVTNGNENAYYVKDNGVGFDMRFSDKLFRVFERLHGPGEFAGAGIGLATVKRIIVRLGGRVWAEGRPEQGATVYFTLPKKESE